MMQATTTQALGQARLAELHHQAQHDALARAARQARHAKQQSGGHGPGLLAAVTRWARRPGTATGSPSATLTVSSAPWTPRRGGT